MAPKKLPRNKLKKSARNYRDNPESRAKKMPPKDNVTRLNQRLRIELSSNEQDERQGRKVRAERIFHTLSQEN